jgi:hypothetical protein
MKMTPPKVYPTVRIAKTNTLINDHDDDDGDGSGQLKSKTFMTHGYTIDEDDLMTMPADERVMRKLGYYYMNPDSPFPTDDKFRLAEVSLDPILLATRYPIKWGSIMKQELFKGATQLRPNIDYADRVPVNVTRLRAQALPVYLEANVKDGGWPEVTFVPKVYTVDCSDLDLNRKEVDWYVNFAEQQLMDYYEDDFVSSAF